MFTAFTQNSNMSDFFPLRSIRQTFPYLESLGVTDRQISADSPPCSSQGSVNPPSLPCSPAMQSPTPAWLLGLRRAGYTEKEIGFTAAVTDALSPDNSPSHLQTDCPSPSPHSSTAQSPHFSTALSPHSSTASSPHSSSQHPAGSPPSGNRGTKRYHEPEVTYTTITTLHCTALNCTASIYPRLQVEIKVSKKTVLCPDCNEKITGGQLARHVREKHSQEKFVCRCGKHFVRAETLKIHKKQNCKSDPNIFPSICMCGESFKTEIKLKNHQKDSRYCVRKTICNKCKSKFSTIKELKEHTATCQTEAEENVDQGEDDGPEGEAMEDFEDYPEVEAEREKDNPPTPGDSNNPNNVSAFDNLILGDTGLDELNYEEFVTNVGNLSFTY